MLLAAACTSLRRHGRAPDFEASSLASIYLPAGRFRGFVVVDSSRLEVRVDTAIVVAPASTRDLRVSVIVATNDSTAGYTVAGSANDVRPWLLIAESEAVSIGDARLLHDLRFTVALPERASLARAWLIFRFHGRAGDPRGLGGGGDVRTFACSITDLAGRTRAARARQRRLAANYLAAC